jgi:hypothetical protein
MNEKTQKAFGIFWDRIGHAENMIFDHTGPRYPPFVKEDMDDSFFEAYAAIKQALKPLANKRHFIGPPEAPGYPVFEAETAHEALMFILNPPEALFGLPAILTKEEYLTIKREAQEEYRKILMGGKIGSENQGIQTNVAVVKPAVGYSTPQPRWDSEARILWFGDKKCKIYRQQAHCQILILEHFENAGWKKSIIDPLGNGPDNATRQRTSDAVRALNKNDYIKFELSGDGKGILWESL